MLTETCERPTEVDVSRERRGRPSRTAVTPLGKFLQKQLKAKEMTLSGLAQRLQVSRTTVNPLFYGNPAFIDDTIEERICWALALNDMERREFHGLVNEINGSTSISTKACEVPPSNQGGPRGRGRPAKAPINALGDFLQKLLKEKGITRKELARRLNVSPSTIGRILNGDTSTVRSMNEESICQALAMNYIERREFHGLVHERPINERKVFAYVPTKGIDLDWADYYSRELQREFDLGNVRHVLEEAKQCYTMRYPVKDARTPEIRMRFGKLLATAQDVILPWNDRISPTIRTYKSIEEMLFSFPLEKVPSYQAHYAYILAHRAPLYREIGQFDESVQEFTIALEQCINEVDDIDLHVELYYSRAHVWVVQGNVQNWLNDLEAAREVAQRAEGKHREQLLGLITYTQGEGYKRLAYTDRLDLSERERSQYADQGLACFEQTGFVAKKRWAAHALIHGVAEAQCLVRLDPNEAIRRGKLLRVHAQEVYPSIIQKIDRTISVARRRLHQKGGLPGS